MLKASGSIFKVSSISQNIGLAPTAIIDQVEAMKEFGGVITSSPGPIPSALRTKTIASDPFPTEITCSILIKSAIFF